MKKTLLFKQITFAIVAKKKKPTSSEILFLTFGGYVPGPGITMPP